MTLEQRFLTRWIFSGAGVELMTRQPDGRGYELVSSVRVMIPQKFSVEEELMHVKYVDVKSLHVGVMWKFGRGVISSDDIISFGKNSEYKPNITFNPDYLKLLKPNFNSNMVEFLDLDLHLINNNVVSNIFDKRDSFKFHIIKIHKIGTKKIIDKFLSRKRTFDDNKASTSAQTSIVPKIKSRKYSQEYLNFGFTITEVNGEEKPLCVICSKILAADSMKPNKLKRHFETLQARCKKPHTIAEELILPAAIEIVETMFGDNFAKELQSIPLSNDTVSRRIDDIAFRRETVLASPFYSQYGLSSISGLPLHDDKGRYRPEKSMTDSQKDLSQLVAIYFVVFQCNPSLLSGTLLWASDTEG
ncbi:hypothetical protein TNCV_1562851 [Trichonephila clavipes]|nr:hypothetical protein TNCV_1562851 [Trichonephila clavipes]